MRNLHVRVHQRVATGVEGGVTGVWCKDPDSREVYTVDNEGKIWKLGKDNSDPSLLVDLKAEGFLEGCNKCHCLNICPLPELQAVLVALSSGELLQIGVSGPGDLEEVGAVSAGLLAFDLSPDSELITLVTAELNLILMTRDYTPLSETQIHQAEFGEGKFVNVGWGAKETQFHGSEGKAARAVKKESGTLTDSDDRRVRISWRGDGEMVAVSYVTPGHEGEDGLAVMSRKIRIFDRQGTLYSTSEDCVGLEHTISWKPSGNLIATTIRKPNKHVVGFFEKNGLQHGEFALRSSGKVLEVCWNCDSSILAVWIQPEAQLDHCILQFWTVGNYHWYLKQEIHVKYGTQSYAMISPKWDAEDTNLFHYFSTTADNSTAFNSITFARETDTSSGKTEDDLALVAAIDGQTVKMTPMREAVIPPPMSAYEIHLDVPVTAVMFQNTNSQTESSFKLENNSSNNLGVVAGNKVYFFAVTEADKGTKSVGDEAVRITGAGGNGYIVQTSRHALLHSIQVSGIDLSDLCNFTWIDGMILTSTDDPQPALVILQESDGNLVEGSRLPCEESIYSITPAQNGEAIVQLTNGSVLKLKDNELEPVFDWARVCSSAIASPYGILGLTSSGKLYLNEKEISTNITSMFLHSHFLLATTMDHRLIALPLEDLERGNAQVNWQEAGNRRVERGSRLVTAVAQGSRTVLQMPRGNLETIQPRSLTIHLLKDLLNGLKYKDSFLLARRQRINLNLLVDHDPDLFLANIGQFVSQVNSDPDHLNIFLAELKDENVCTTMYTPQYKDNKKQDWTEKVAKVCIGIRQVLEDQQAGSCNGHINLVPILGTLVRQGNMLEEALHRIQKLRDLGEENLCDQGLRYILYSVDVNLLFNIALGTYDFDLVLMVAEKSQKDPKEYLPILNKYKSMPPDYMKYSIDKDLKRYPSALAHIAKCPDNFEDCLQLIQDQRLYKQGLTLFPKGSDNYKSVCKIYGEYMDGKRYYLEASYLYEQACDFVSAVRTSERECSWERAGHLARTAGWSQEQLNQLYNNLAIKLEETDRGTESAIIWRDWLQNTEESIAVLARTKCWRECLRQIRAAGRMDLLETHLLPELSERHQVLSATLTATQQKIKQQVERLELIRGERSRAAITADDEGGDDMNGRNLEDGDNFSDTTSVGGSIATSSAKSKSTLATRTSNKSKSSKNRRKHDRKLYSTKEGSTHEDLGLIAELHEALSTLPNLISEIATITRVYLDLGRLLEPGLDLAGLQAQAQHLVSLCEEVKPRIWPGQEIVKERYGPEATVQDIIRGAGAIQTEYRSPLELMEAQYRFPPRINIDPHWKLEVL